MIPFCRAEPNANSAADSAETADTVRLYAGNNALWLNDFGLVSVNVIFELSARSYCLQVLSVYMLMENGMEPLPAP